MEVFCVLALPRAIIVHYFGNVFHVASTAIWAVQYGAYSYVNSPEKLMVSFICGFYFLFFFSKYAYNIVPSIKSLVLL